MKYKIEENLIIEAESENEEFCFINAFADGTEGIIDICPNYKRDLELYKSYSTTDHFYPDRGSRMFYFSVGSLSEYLNYLPDAQKEFNQVVATCIFNFCSDLNILNNREHELVRLMNC